MFFFTDENPAAETTVMPSASQPVENVTESEEEEDFTYLDSNRKFDKVLI